MYCTYFVLCGVTRNNFPEAKPDDDLLDLMDSTS